MSNDREKPVLIRAKQITKGFGRERPVLNQVNLCIREGDRIGLSGRSGAGKTTLARLLVCLDAPDSGEIYYKGVEITGLKGKEKKKIRPDLQLIFQEYRQSLTPHRKVGQLLEEMLYVRTGVSRREAAERAREMLPAFGLPQRLYNQYPRQLSGGEAQRVALARTLLMDPMLLVLDEVTSGLDKETAVRILLNIEKTGENRKRRAVVFISHDENIRSSFCDRHLLITENGCLNEE